MSYVDTTAVTINPRARRRRLLRKRFLRRPLAIAGLVVALTFVVAAILAPVIAPYSASATDFNALLAHSSRHHLLGMRGERRLEPGGVGLPHRRHVRPGPRLRRVG